MAEVHLIGQILDATNFEDRSLFAKWNISSGSCWQVLEGFTEGQTHLATIASSGEVSHSWSHPFDIHYITNGLQGWPRLEFQVWGVNWLGKCNISAYGSISIPSNPGKHELICSTWRPVGDFRRRMVDYLTGYRMHLVDPSSIISDGLNRQAIHSQSMGTITTKLAVVLRGFEQYGVDL